MAEIFEAVAKLSFEANIQEGREAVEILSKQDNIINELTATQKKLGEEISSSSKDNKKVVKELNDEYKQVEKTIAKTQKSVQDEIKKSTKVIQDSINSVDFGKFKNLFTGLEFDQLDQQIVDAQGDMQQLAIITDALQGKLNKLDPNSQAFKELNAVIEVSETVLGEYATASDLVGKTNVDLKATFEDVYGELQPVNTRIGELEDRMYELRLANQQNGDEYEALEKELVKFKKAVREVDQSVDASVETSKGLKFVAEGTQAVAAGFEVGAGAAALFGAEQEDLEKAQTKLLAVMALANGLEQLSTLLKKEGIIATVGQSVASKAAAAAQAAYAVVVGTSTGALKLFKLALAATGIGAIIVAIGTLVANWDELTESIGNTSEEQKLYNRVSEKTTEKVSEARAAVSVAGQAFEDAKAGVISKKDALIIYNETLGASLGFANSFNEAEQLFINNSGKFIKAIEKRAQAEALSEIYKEDFKALNDLQREYRNIVADYKRDGEKSSKQFRLNFKDTLLLDSRATVNRREQAEVNKRLEFTRKQLTKTTSDAIKAESDLGATVGNTNKKVTKSVVKTAKDVKRVVNKELKKDPPELKINLRFDSDTDDLDAELKKLKAKVDKEKGLQKNIDNLGTDAKGPADKNDFFAPENQPDFIDPRQLSEENLEKVRQENFEKELKRRAKVDRLNEERRKKAKELFRSELNNLAEQSKALIQIKIDEKDRLIQIQEQRLNDAENNQEKSNEINIKAERDRLDKLKEEREKYVRAQKIIDAAIIATNQAVAISAAIKGIATAAGEGGAGAAFTIAANVAALVAGLAAVSLAINNAATDTGNGFYDGGYTGDGNPKSRSKKLGNKPYTYHKGEFVMDNYLTRQYRDLFDGIHERKLNIQEHGNGSYYISPKRLNVEAIARDHNKVNMHIHNNNNNSELITKFDSLRKIIQEKETKVESTFDENGFALNIATTLSSIKLKETRL